MWSSSKFTTQFLWKYNAALRGKPERRVGLHPERVNLVWASSLMIKLPLRWRAAASGSSLPYQSPPDRHSLERDWYRLYWPGSSPPDTLCWSALDNEHTSSPAPSAWLVLQWKSIAVKATWVVRWYFRILNRASLIALSLLTRGRLWLAVITSSPGKPSREQGRLEQRVSSYANQVLQYTQNCPWTPSPAWLFLNPWLRIGGWLVPKKRGVHLEKWKAKVFQAHWRQTTEPYM